MNKSQKEFAIVLSCFFVGATLLCLAILIIEEAVKCPV